MRYAILRLEEEIRAVLDIRQHVIADAALGADQRKSLLFTTIGQLRDLDAAVRILRPYASEGRSTMSSRVMIELRELIGRPATPNPEAETCAST